MYSILKIICGLFGREYHMPVKKVQYSKIREEMLPGDIIAFGGKSHFSEIIKFATLSSVSHVATVLHTKIPTDTKDRYFNQVIESTGSKGVAITRLSELLNHYNGDIWWLPLKKEIRQSFDQEKFFNFLFRQAKEKKPYDMIQAAGSAVDIIENLLPSLGVGANEEDFSKFFCSELVAAGLEKAGILGSVNASEVTPIELCTWSIYEDSYYLLKGDVKTRIKNYNTRPPRQDG